MMGMGLGMTNQAMNFQQQGGQQPYQQPFQGGQPAGQQATQQTPPPETAAGGQAEDPVAKLAQFKQMLDQGLITQEDFDEAKQKLLGL